MLSQRREHHFPLIYFHGLSGYFVHQFLSISDYAYHIFKIHLFPSLIICEPHPWSPLSTSVRLLLASYYIFISIQPYGCKRQSNKSYLKFVVRLRNAMHVRFLLMFLLHFRYFCFYQVIIFSVFPCALYFIYRFSAYGSSFLFFLP